MADTGSAAGFTVIHDVTELVVGPDGGTGVVVLEDAMLAALDGGVVAIGPTAEALMDYPAENAEAAIDATDKTVFPGFVDPHTHALFAGDHSDGFVAKLQGAAYEDILADGGSIFRTVDAVHGVSDDELTMTLTNHLNAMLAHGTTTTEVKASYGLDTETELRMLSVIDAAGSDHPVDVTPMFIGAHAISRSTDAKEYIESVVSGQLPVVAAQDTAELCDVFCEHDVFTAERSRRILDADRDHGLTPKIRAGEFAAVDGTDVAASVDTASADYLLHTDDEGQNTLVDAGVTPVLLPGTMFDLEADYADTHAFLDTGHEITLATDFSPGCFA